MVLPPLAGAQVLGAGAEDPRGLAQVLPGELGTGREGLVRVGHRAAPAQRGYATGLLVCPSSCIYPNKTHRAHVWMCIPMPA